MEPEASTPFHTGENKSEEKPLEATPIPSEPVKTEESSVATESKEVSETIKIEETVESKTSDTIPTAGESTPALVVTPPVDLAVDPIAAPTATVAPSAVPVATTALPDELKGWNWGAFFLHWFWAIGNKAWIGLLAIIVPFPIMQIVLGLKGNEWAWQNRKFESVDQFKAVQKAWTKWGVIIFIVSTVLIIGMLVMTIVTGIGSARDKASSIKDNPIPINLTQ